MSDHPTCPTCGSPVKITGHTTHSYEPIHDAVIRRLQAERDLYIDVLKDIGSGDQPNDCSATDMWAIANETLAEGKKIREGSE